MLTIAGVVSLCIWIYLVAAHGGFWRIAKHIVHPAQLNSSLAYIAAVVPARDEADVIARCVQSLLSQDGVRIHVFVVDDHSSDGTSEIALQAARAACNAEQFTVIRGRPLPLGWSGKLWAVQQGIEQALALNPDYLLLTDADIVHSPGNLRDVSAIARIGGYDLVSLMVKLHCQSFAERTLIPAFIFFFLKLYPPAWITNPRRKTAGAAGGCILISPRALKQAGGIEAIRHEIIDDCALARCVKGSGGKLWLGLSPDTASVRPYGSFAEIGSMISRSAFNQLRHSALILAFALAGLMLTYVLPVLLVLFSHRILPVAEGATAWLLMSVCFLPAVRLYRLNPMWVLALPLIALFYIGATVHSAIMYWLGKGGEWKGRVQDTARTAG